MTESEIEFGKLKPPEGGLTAGLTVAADHRMMAIWNSA